MAGPIYLLGLSRRTDAWYQLSVEERESLIAKVMAFREEDGVKRVIGCWAKWSSEWEMFGVDEHPDIESVHKHFEHCNEVDWFRYIEGKIVLGTKWDLPS